MPLTESGLHLEAVLQVDPGWAPSGQYVELDYIVHPRNYGEAKITLNGVGQILPPLFEFVDGSYNGPAAVFTKIWVTDYWELDWEFTSPFPKVDSESS